MTSPQDNRIFHFPPWGPGEPIESYRHRKRLAFDTWSAQRSAMLARTDDNLRTLCNPCHQAEGRNAVLSH